MSPLAPVLFLSNLSIGVSPPVSFMLPLSLNGSNLVPGTKKFATPLRVLSTTGPPIVAALVNKLGEDIDAFDETAFLADVDAYKATKDVSFGATIDYLKAQLDIQATLTA